MKYYYSLDDSYCPEGYGNRILDENWNMIFLSSYIDMSFYYAYSGTHNANGIRCMATNPAFKYLEGYKSANDTYENIHIVDSLVSERKYKKRKVEKKKDIKEQTFSSTSTSITKARESK